MCQVLYIFVDPAITSCTINYAHFKHKKNNNSQAIWPNSSRTRISTQGFKTLPYLPGHSANQSKTMLSTLPPLSPQAPLIFHLPILHPRTLPPPPAHSTHLPHPLPDIHIPHCVHLLPIQSLPETSANRALPSPALPSLSHTQSALLLHLFTGTHIHHEPQRMPQEADLTLLLWTSHQAQV